MSAAFINFPVPPAAPLSSTCLSGAVAWRGFFFGDTTAARLASRQWSHSRLLLLLSRHDKVLVTSLCIFSLYVPLGVGVKSTHDTRDLMRSISPRNGTGWPFLDYSLRDCRGRCRRESWCIIIAWRAATYWYGVAMSQT